MLRIRGRDRYRGPRGVTGCSTVIEPRRCAPARSSVSPASRATVSGRLVISCPRSLVAGERRGSWSAVERGLRVDAPTGSDGGRRCGGDPRGPARLRGGPRHVASRRISRSRAARPPFATGRACSMATGLALEHARPGADRGVRYDPVRRPRRAVVVAVRWQPAAGGPRPGARATHPQVLVAAQPTRGLDVGAIEYMSEQSAKPRCGQRASVCC